MVEKYNKIFGSIKSAFVFVIIATIAVITFYVSQTLNSAKEQVLNYDNPYTSISYSYYVDESSTKKIHDLSEFLPLFSNVDVNNIPYELSNKTYWIKIDLENYTETAIDAVLHVDNTLLANLDIYQFKGSRLTHHLYSLNKNTKLQNNITTALNAKDKAFPHIQFQLDAAQRLAFLVRVNTMGPPKVPFNFYLHEEFENRLQMSEAIFGGFIAIILLMSAYNLVLFYAVKDKVYLVYIGYLLSAFVVLASVNGFGYLIFPNGIQSWLNNNTLFFHALLVSFLLLFALYFLRFDLAKTKVYPLGLGFVVVMMLISISSLFFDQITQAKIFFSLQPIFYVFSLYLVFNRLKHDYSWARFYFLSWIPLLIGAAIQPLMLLNFIEYSFLARHAFLFGVVIESAFMAFALAERMRRNEQDRHQDLGYHQSTKLPRKLILENIINQSIHSQSSKFSVIVIKPEQLERIALYVDDVTQTELFINLNKRLSKLLGFNDAIVELTTLKEKVCFLESSCLALVLDHKKNHQPIQVLVNSIQQVVAENYKIKQLQLPLSANVGIANYPEHGKRAHNLINHAQLALRNAEISHQKWAYFTAEISDKNNYLLKLASDMKTALANNHFKVFHQPQIDLKTRKVCGSECLIRWQHPTEGSIPPDVFIPVAEDMGLINQITLWVVNQALLQHKEIVESGFNNHMVSINISGKDISSDKFFEHVKEIIELSEIAADKMIFEITESAMITDNHEAIEVLEQLSDLGITISIDDFGTGYSSMSYITQLPFQELKIDRQFVEDVCDSIKRKTICETTVKMAKGLKLEVVAEGINSALDERTLRMFGCDIGQGYYYAQPMPIEDYLSWLNEQASGQRPVAQQAEFIPAEKKPTINQDVKKKFFDKS